MESVSKKEHIRIAIIGKTGVGKSALGNTLLGSKVFESKPAGQSVTKTCQVATGYLGDKLLKVVDTPGIMDTRGEDVKDEVAKAIAHLSPGPHAFIIVLQPNRETKEEQRALDELENLFDDTSFLSYTMIVMVRKNEIEDDDKPVPIHTFIEKYASPGVQKLYEKCNRRIVAVENKTKNDFEKKRYAEEVVENIMKIGGYYSHEAFTIIQKNKKLREQMQKIQDQLDREARERERQEREREAERQQLHKVAEIQREEMRYLKEMLQEEIRQRKQRESICSVL